MDAADIAVQKLREQGVFGALVGLIQQLGRFLIFVWDGKEDPIDPEPLDPRYVAYYEQHIRAQVEDFEARRQQAIRVLRKRAPWAVAAQVVLVLCLNLLPIDPMAHSMMQFIGFGFLLILTLPWVMSEAMRYRASIKQQVFPHVVGFFGPQWRYHPYGLHDTDDQSDQPLADRWMQFDILPEHDAVKTEDAVQGTYKDVALQQVECRLISYGDKDDVTEFAGMLVQIEVPKRFTGHTMVLREQPGRVRNGLQKRAMKAFVAVKLEDPRFEARYEVFGTDAVEARYLLTPSFMERLIALEAQFEQEYKVPCALRCAFKDGKLLLVLPCRYDGFDTGNIYRPVNFHHEINRVLREMDQLFAIVDVLKLDDRTGL